MLGKTPNKVYNPFLKAGLGYKIPERLKKAVAAQPKMCDGEKLHSTKLVIDSPDSEETLEDAEESRLKMRNKMVQLNYGKLNALYETFVPQQDFSMEQTYFSIPSTSTNGSESKAVTSDLPILKMPKESKLLKMFDTLGMAINGLRTRIDITLLEDRQRRWMSDSQNSLREFYKTDKNELLKDELAKSSSDSKDIQANLLKRIKILENDFKQSQDQSIDFKLKLQHQKEKIACDVSWNSNLSTLNDENVLLKTQVESTYAYADVRAQNQDLLMTIFELKDKLRTNEKGKHVNTKFDKSETLGKLVCVTPLHKNLGNKAKNVSNTKVKTDSVESSNSVRRPKSKGTKSKNRVLKNTKSSSAYVQKISRSVSIDSNKCETKDSNVSQTNASVLNSKTVNAVSDGSNIVCVSCGKDVFLLSHEKCVAHYALSRNSNVKRALFTTPVPAKSKNLGATSIVAKSRLNVSNTPKATNKVFSASSLSHASSQSKTLSNYMKNKILTSQKWQRWFEYQQSFNLSPKSKTAQSLSSETKSRIRVRSTSNTPVTTQKWVAKLSTLPSAFVSCDAVRFGNDHFAAITGYGDYVQGNLMICHNLEADDLLIGSCDSNLYTISISKMAASSPVCVMSIATSTKSWLWHSRLSHLNFGTINQLTSKDLVDALPKFKYNKDHLCSACEQGKSKKASLLPKLVPSTESKLELLHMDLCGPMRVVSINGKKYILVIVDDYSRFTWIYFLRTKDEAPDMIINFVNQVQRNLKAQILMIRTDNGTEFKNEKLWELFEKLGIVHQTSVARTPQQNGVVKRQTRTLVEAASINNVYLGYSS
ncbi:retrovirus-related pol polyprotein from transposon TNT 1-94 [Tanacetum coccineum]|uniref:Retrovirus-related pol polyprotein from transposon TNT 1-94 n=1 Tax=Tanacetum coccineum TaxID=301880 RepID=A0ABQ4Y8D1_9ASTR